MGGRRPPQATRRRRGASARSRIATAEEAVLFFGAIVELVAGVAEVARGLAAPLRELGLAEAEFAILRITLVAALAHLGRAGLACVEVVERAFVGAVQEDVDRPVRGVDGATTEAVASWRRERSAEVDAFLRGLVLTALQVFVARSVRAAELLAGIVRIAREIPFAALALPAVAVEEAVLAAIHVVAGDAGRERALVVVAGSRAFGVLQIDEAVAVVVDEVATRIDAPRTIDHLGGRRDRTPPAAAARGSS